MSKKSLCWVLLTVPLLVFAPNTTEAVEYGELVQKDGQWAFKNTEDPVFKLMRDTGWITNERYFEVSGRTGKNWIEPADAVLIRRQSVDWGRYLHTAAHLPDWIDLGFEQRTRFESYDQPWRSNQVAGNGGTDFQVPLRSIVRFGLGGDGPFRFLFEGIDSRSFSDGARADFQNNTSVNEFDVLQLFGSLTLKNVLGTGLRTDFHFGRFTMDLGKRRLVARNEFRNTIQAFDGFHWQIGEDKLWRIRAFVVEPVVIQPVRLDEMNSKFFFWGTYLESRHFTWFQFDAYYLGLNDKRGAVANRRNISTYGVRLFKEPVVGEMDYEIESGYQTGNTGGRDHVAHFQNAEVGYTFNAPWTPRLLAQYTYASGDDDPTDDENGSFDRLFGARRFDFNPTGIFGPFFRSNINTPGWRLILQPGKSVTLQVKHRFWYLAQAEDQFAGNGLRDVTGQSGSYLGHDVELRAQWAINRNLGFDVGYMHWFKGSYFDSPAILVQMPQGGNKDTDYFYAQATVRM
ncbi:alginate export family protein [Candidatus Nitrospira nitrificans]|uniref:Alginate export domain-containing protein n=1 Tax=Candidatus Nitrospira nitrificans TaxID=1742973 RepID=A0A0S4L7S7_9BACT|nr:alginate export family protein [Candidatus Nitrospira nitrificans]CUS33589.1 conserved exported hypothetical protein [Candidatus Nitrospira nitrificans]